jgi:L-lactate dehydrogenase complex protein LldG
MLDRIRAANSGRELPEHPGPFEGWRPASENETNTEAFARSFGSVGGEVVRLANAEAARSWLATFLVDFEAAAYGTGIAAGLRTLLPEGPPESAGVAISVARAGIAETGSLVMDARDGRRAQLLCPTHIVLLDSSAIRSTARATFAELALDLPSAFGLHSGPSKSADIGQVMVKGVHGPGRIIALILEETVAP